MKIHENPWKSMIISRKRWKSSDDKKPAWNRAKVSIGAAGRFLRRVALGIHTICAFAMSCRFIGVRLARLHPFLISEAAFAQMQATLTATQAFLLTILADSSEVPIPDALCLERLFDLPKMTLHALVRCAFLFLLLHPIFARMPTVFTIPLSKVGSPAWTFAQQSWPRKPMQTVSKHRFVECQMGRRQRR